LTKKAIQPINDHNRLYLGLSIKNKNIKKISMFDIKIMLLLGRIFKYINKMMFNIIKQKEQAKYLDFFIRSWE